jgi:hypothetical protein
MKEREEKIVISQKKCLNCIDARLIDNVHYSFVCMP